MAILAKAEDIVEERDQEDELIGKEIYYTRDFGVACYRVVKVDPLTLAHVDVGETTVSLTDEEIATISVDKVRRKVKARQRAKDKGWI